MNTTNTNTTTSATTAASTRGTLRLCTAGSVDDGKSTFVGRLLHDTRSVAADQLDAVHRASAAKGLTIPDLSLLVDGLRAEREQGITIDVAYRYFATPARAFILADTPGHVQYTRNTVTGVSTSDAVVLLVDARNGVVPQTRRHAAAAAVLGVRHLVLAVNKIDLVGHSEEVFDRVVADFAAIVAEYGLGSFTAVPTSALHGDNVVTRSDRIPWYEGPSVLEVLETLDIDREIRGALRFPIQYVIRDHATDYRGYAGRVAVGSVEVGDVVSVGGGRTSVVDRIDTADGPVERAETGDSVTVLLADDVDLSRGDLLTDADDRPADVRRVEATVVHLAESPLGVGSRVLVRYGSAEVRGRLAEVGEVLDVDGTAADGPAAETLGLNDVARVVVDLAEALPVEPYRRGGAVGAFLLVDPVDGATLSAGLVGDRTAVLAAR